MRGNKPSLDVFKSRFSSLLDKQESFSAIVYRSSTPKYATETDLLTGIGSQIYGGRWNPPGLATVYASLTPETAMAESLAQHRYYGLAISSALPRTFVALEIKLQAIVDFRFGWIRKKLGVSFQRMVSIDWRGESKKKKTPITQILGKAGSECGFEGLIVPSAADPHGHNLVLFPNNLGGMDQITVINSHQL